MDTPCCSIMSVISSDILTCSLEGAPARPVEFHMCIYWRGLIGRTARPLRNEAQVAAVAQPPSDPPSVPCKTGARTPENTPTHLRTHTHTHTDALAELAGAALLSPGTLMRLRLTYCLPAWTHTAGSVVWCSSSRPRNSKKKPQKTTKERRKKMIHKNMGGGMNRWMDGRMWED